MVEEAQPITGTRATWVVFELMIESPVILAGLAAGVTLGMIGMAMMRQMTARRTANTGRYIVLAFISRCSCFKLIYRLVNTD
jgi:hypothetical protein